MTCSSFCLVDGAGKISGLTFPGNSIQNFTKFAVESSLGSFILWESYYES